MNYASHYTDDNVFGQRAKMRVPMHRYTAQLHLNNQGIQHKIVAVLEVENLLYTTKLKVVGLLQRMVERHTVTQLGTQPRQ